MTGKICREDTDAECCFATTFDSISPSEVTTAAQVSSAELSRARTRKLRLKRRVGEETSLRRKHVGKEGALSMKLRNQSRPNSLLPDKTAALLDSFEMLLATLNLASLFPPRLDMFFKFMFPNVSSYDVRWSVPYRPQSSTPYP